ncbi:MAG: nuclear transport factor 2 family protein [Acidobacteria bacterium]|nr:nuclear transport factor 2 family protein [Acidobacteriota bacterium]
MQFKFIQCALVIALAGVSAFAQSKDESALRALVNKMAAAQANYDPKTLDNVFTSDFIEVSPVGEVDPRDKVLGFYKPEDKPPADKMTLTIETNEFSIRNYGKFAIVIARFDYKIVSGGKPMPTRSIRATVVARKEKGEWKIASAQYTGIK